MSLNTCLADLEAQGVLVVLVLNRLMKTFSGGVLQEDAFQIISDYYYK